MDTIRTGLLSAAGAVIALACLAVAVLAQTPGALSDGDLIARLKGGGFNLYVRHAATNWSESDHIREAGDWTSCDPRKVRQLSGEGRRDADAVGKAIQALQVPMGKIYSSPYCRAVETAKLMGRGPVETTHDLMNLRSAEFVGGRAATVERARTRLAIAPAPGTNSLFVAHGNLARAATGLYPAEGEALAFRPLGNGQFQFVGRLTPGQWVRLAERLGGKP